MNKSWALVTGGGGDIGRETTLRLADAGNNIVVADIAKAKAEETAHLVEKLGCQARAVTINVSDPKDVALKLDEQIKDIGAFQYVANIAGIYGEGPIEELPADMVRDVFSVNIFGLFYICKAVLPTMMERRDGAFVNIASVQAQRGEPNAAAYAASKGAVISFTKALAREKGPLGIRANIVAPGPIDTALYRGNDHGAELELRNSKRLEVIPLRRLGIPADVAATIAFLLSPAANYITGQVVAVGGGEVMQ